MQPLYFGPASSPLFGAYHSPPGGVGGRGAYLLCGAIAHEQIRSHRAFRRLAEQLAAAGFPTLRFDYTGSGDSAGDDEDGNVSRWVDDIAAAAEELMSSSGEEQLSIVALRAGGLLAAEACRTKLSVDKLVLWDPISSGRRFIADLRALARDAEVHPYIFSVEAVWREKLRRMTNGPSARRLNEHFGFVFSNQLQEELERLHLVAAKPMRAAHIWMVSGREDEDVSTTAAALSQMGHAVEVATVTDAYTWTDANTVYDQIVPSQIPLWITQMAEKSR